MAGLISGVSSSYFAENLPLLFYPAATAITFKGKSLDPIEFASVQNQKKRTFEG